MGHKTSIKHYIALWQNAARVRQNVSGYRLWSVLFLCGGDRSNKHFGSKCRVQPRRRRWSGLGTRTPWTFPTVHKNWFGERDIKIVYCFIVIVFWTKYIPKCSGWPFFGLCKRNIINMKWRKQRSIGLKGYPTWGRIKRLSSQFSDCTLNNLILIWLDSYEYSL